MNLSLVKTTTIRTVDVVLGMNICVLEEEKKLNVKVKFLKVRERIDEVKRIHFTWKLRTIKELGDVANKEDDTANILKEITTNPYPENVVEKVKEEVRRYEMMPAASQKHQL